MNTADRRQFRGYGFLYDSHYMPGEDLDPPFNRSSFGFRASSALSMATMELRGHHYDDEVFGSVNDGFLEAWLDPYGLAVSFDLPADHPRASLMASGIYSHKLNGLSITFTPLRYHHAIEDGEEVVVVNQATVSEVSIVDSPRCWDARCWATDDLNLPSGLARLNEKFEEGLVERARSGMERSDREHRNFMTNAARLNPMRSPSASVMPRGRRGVSDEAPRRPSVHAPKWRPPQQMLDDIDRILADAATLRGRQWVIGK
jgi:HK97 family phage prohead protease